MAPMLLVPSRRTVAQWAALLLLLGLVPCARSFSVPTTTKRMALARSSPLFVPSPSSQLTSASQGGRHGKRSVSSRVWNARTPTNNEEDCHNPNNKRILFQQQRWRMRRIARATFQTLLKKSLASPKRLASLVVCVVAVSFLTSVGTAHATASSAAGLLLQATGGSLPTAAAATTASAAAASTMGRSFRVPAAVLTLLMGVALGGGKVAQKFKPGTDVDVQDKEDVVKAQDDKEDVADGSVLKLTREGESKAEAMASASVEMPSTPSSSSSSVASAESKKVLSKDSMASAATRLEQIKQRNKEIGKSLKAQSSQLRNLRKRQQKEQQLAKKKEREQQKKKEEDQLHEQLLKQQIELQEQERKKQLEQSAAAAEQSAAAASTSPAESDSTTTASTASSTSSSADSSSTSSTPTMTFKPPGDSFLDRTVISWQNTAIPGYTAAMRSTPSLSSPFPPIAEEGVTMETLEDEIVVVEDPTQDENVATDGDKAKPKKRLGLISKVGSAIKTVLPSRKRAAEEVKEETTVEALEATDDDDEEEEKEENLAIGQTEEYQRKQKRLVQSMAIGVAILILYATSPVWL